jgi:hypothetical protein
MCKFHICATRHIHQKNGHQAHPIWGLAMFFKPCEKQRKTSRDGALNHKAFSHVFSSTVLADGRGLKAHVPLRTGHGLLRRY